MSKVEEAKSSSANGSQTNPASADEKSINEAVSDLKLATQSLYEAISALGVTTGQFAKHKAEEGKDNFSQVGEKVEEKISEKPLLYLGIAFAAGWLGSRLNR